MQPNPHEVVAVIFIAAVFLGPPIIWLLYGMWYATHVPSLKMRCWTQDELQKWDHAERRAMKWIAAMVMTILSVWIIVDRVVL